MMINKQKLRKLANKATPGDWYSADEACCERHEDDNFRHGCSMIDPDDDSAFIAAASPSTVLALLDEIDALYADYTSLLAERDAAQSIATQATRERAAISIQLQSVQADMGTIAGALDADNDDVGTLVGLIQSRLADRSEALAALRSIARYISCEPEDHEDLVEAMRLLVQERDEARAERDRLHATLKAVADVCIDKGGLRVSECVAEDAPPRAVAKLVEQRDRALASYQDAMRIASQVEGDNIMLRAVIDRLGEWTHVFGAALKPRSADTYGEGVRDAKNQVARILAARRGGVQPDDESRCAVCGWPLATDDTGCVRGDCSMRPRPERLYAPERAAKEAAIDTLGGAP